MARYPRLLGRKVEVLYRAGEILLPASGTFVADSGRSIFLEQSLLQRGQPKHFRWEIPYQFIVRIDDKTENESAPASPSTSKESAVSEARFAASAPVAMSGLHTLADKPKTA